MSEDLDMRCTAPDCGWTGLMHECALVDRAGSFDGSVNATSIEVCPVCGAEVVIDELFPERDALDPH